MFALNDKRSFNKLVKLPLFLVITISGNKQYLLSNKRTIIIIGTKCDLLEERKISHEEIQKNIIYKYFEISVKNEMNYCHKIFDYILSKNKY